MNQRRAGFFAAFLIGVLLVSSMISYVNAAGGGQNDASTGSDADDACDSDNNILNPGRYQGNLIAGTDATDWYRIIQTANRPTYEMLLQSLSGNNALVLELHETNCVSLVQAAGGADGAWALQRQITGTLALKVGLATGGTTGKYELVIGRHDEEDGGKVTDAGPAAANRADLGVLPGGRIVVEGHFSPNDETDVYSFSTAGVQSAIAGVHFSPTAALTLSLTPDSATPSLPSTERAGPGFVTAYHPNIGNSLATQWLVTVGRTNAATQSVSYTLAITVNPEPQDPGTTPTEPDAKGDALGSKPIVQGIHRGQIARGVDDRDVYKLTGVVVGQVISIGASSHEGATDPTRPLLGLILREPGGQESSRVDPCGAAAGITQTATLPGDWYLEVFEQGGTGCTGAVPGSDDEYSLSYRLRTQNDGGAADAPADTAGAPQAPSPAHQDDQFVSTWMDSTDISDTYALGSLAAGKTVRVGATTDVPGMEYNLHLFRGTNLVATSASTAGTARLNVAVGTVGEHFVRFEYRTPAGTRPTGLIEYYVATSENEAPSSVVLAEISQPPTGGGDVTRNAVTLHWSQAVDDDFARYEIHAGRNAGFTPSSVTLKETITTRSDVETTVSGLQSNTFYEFVVRVVDASGLLADSNRRSTTTRSGPLGNTAPTLDGGGVTPPSGSTSTLFKFQVNYTDADNDPPAQRQVVISGVRHDMTTPTANPNFAEGVLYVFETTLTQGTKDFAFEFSDGVPGGTARDPAVDSYKGPSVTQVGNRPPTASASGSPNDGDAPLEVQFDVTASDPDGDALQYCWDFNTANGITCDSSQKAPKHTYTTRGVYTATVFVKDSRGSESSDSVQVNVRGSNNEPPSVDATAQPTEGEAPLTVQFRSNAADVDGTITSHKWDFDNSNGLAQDSTEANPTHTYTKAGSFVATVTVTDNGTASTVDSVTVIVRTSDNSPPSVIVSAEPVEGMAPLVVNFTATVADADGDTITVRWDFDTSDGFGTDATGTVASHTYTDVREYTAMAIATDSKGATATGTVKVRVISGTAGAVIIQAEPIQGKAPLAVSFTADTSQLGADATDYEWDFGDGASGTGKEIIHTYEKPGSYGVTLLVTDENGGEYESTITIRVQGGGSPGLGSVFAIALVIAVAFVLHRRRQGPK